MTESSLLHNSPPCLKCGSKCCRYIAIEIDRPASKREYDNIRWYLLHENISVFVDHKGKWHLEFKTVCKSLSDDGRCSIYNKRPRICKEHGNKEYECEYYDSPHSLYFSTARKFENYLNRKKIDWKWKR